MRFPTGRGFARATRTAAAVVAITASTSLLGGCSGDHDAAGSGPTAAPSTIASVATVATAGATVTVTDAGSPAARPSGSPVKLRRLDQRVLRELAAAGDDRSCPHDLENEIRVGRTSDAVALGKDFSGPDAFVRIADNTTGPGSLVIVELHFVPTDAAVAAMTRRMLREAKRHHGRYDRWETTPVTKC